MAPWVVLKEGKTNKEASAVFNSNIYKIVFQIMISRYL